jgi:hypothetical protein
MNQNWEGNVLEMLEIFTFNFSSNEKIAKGESPTLNSLEMLAFPFLISPIMRNLSGTKAPFHMLEI